MYKIWNSKVQANHYSNQSYKENVAQIQNEEVLNKLKFNNKELVTKMQLIYEHCGKTQQIITRITTCLSYMLNTNL